MTGDDETAPGADAAPSTDDEPYTDGITQKAILFGPDDQVLLTRAGGQWSVPGGTFEYGETIHGGLRRELREELSVTARIGAPVDIVYGAWLDGTGTPLVTTFYRAVTDDRAVELNDEHDDFEWVSPATARERLAELFGRRMERVLARAVTHHALADGETNSDSGTGVDGVSADVVAGLDPFTARADQFEGCETDHEAWLAYLADARERGVAELRERYD